MSRYQKGKTNLDFTEARDSEWQWHQLGHMQVCTLLQTGNHASTPPLSFLQAGCPSCRPTNSVKALKAKIMTGRGEKISGFVPSLCGRQILFVAMRVAHSVCVYCIPVNLTNPLVPRNRTMSHPLTANFPFSQVPPAICPGHLPALPPKSPPRTPAHSYG